MPNELSEKVYPDGTVVKLRDDTAREQISGISASLTERTFNTVAYKALSTNYEYNGCSYTVPDGKVAILYGRTQYSNGKPVGLALSLSNTQLNVISETSNVGNYVLRTPVCMVGGGNTVYLWEKRESVPGSTNTSFIIGMLIG